MKNILLFIMFVIAISGCATRAKYEAKLDKWVGSKEIELVQAWGAPDNVYNSNNAKYLSYIKTKRGAKIHPNLPPSDYYCKTNFVVRDEVIESYSLNGGCKSY